MARRQLTLLAGPPGMVEPEDQRITRALVVSEATAVRPFWVEPLLPDWEVCFGLRIPGDPHGKGSVRVGTWEEKDGSLRSKGFKGKVTRQYERRVQAFAEAQRMKWPGPFPLGGLLTIRILSVKARPKKVNPSWAVDLEAPSGRCYAPVKPDYDNVAKAVGDPLKQAKVIRDDAHLVDGRCVTLFAAVDEEPFVELFLWSRISPRDRHRDRTAR